MCAMRCGFGAGASGVGTAEALRGAPAAAIEEGMHLHALLVFRDQPLTDEQQIAFTVNFGQLENYQSPGHIPRRDEHPLAPGIADFSNLDRHGKIMSAEDRVWFFK